MSDQLSLELDDAAPGDDELAQRNAEHVPEYWMLLTAQDVAALHAGHIPESVREMARWLSDELHEDLQRNACKSVQKARAS